MVAVLSLAVAMPLWSAECVVLLHGLARTSKSMEKLAAHLGEHGYVVANVNYPSTKMKIEALAELAVSVGLKNCEKNNATPVNFVTHSLGGILVRQYFSRHSPEYLKRVVMLGPPNQGSEVVDNLKNTPGFELLNGPAGMQLGTDSDSVPANLAAVNFELGVIAGTKSINLLLSNYLPNPDDGKVSLASTKVEGMCDFMALPVSHPFIMKNKKVMAEVLRFLQRGQFSESDDHNNQCGHTSP